MNSPELERLEQALAAYELPASLGDKVIEQANYKNISMSRFMETLEDLGVTVVATDSVLDRQINISLRNLSLNRILQFVCQQVNVMWLYQDERLLLYTGEIELNDYYKPAGIEKAQLTRAIREEKRRLNKDYQVQQRGRFDSLVITSFEVDALPLSEIIKELNKAPELIDSSDGRLRFLSMFNRKKVDPVGSFSYQGKSLTYMLDAMAEELSFTWAVGEDGKIITVHLKPE